jgi:cytochrome P450
MLLLEAGHVTTANLIGNAVLALLRHPDQLERLRREPALIVDAIEEILRYDGPVRLVGRMAFDDVPLGDKVIRRGETAYVLLGAANRDPARFQEPDRLLIGRKDNAHVAFGWGAHHCVGSILARSSAQTAVDALLCGTTSIELEDTPVEREDLIFLQGWKALPVRLGA